MFYIPLPFIITIGKYLTGCLCLITGYSAVVNVLVSGNGIVSKLNETALSVRSSVRSDDCPDGPDYTEEPIELESCLFDDIPSSSRTIAIYLINEGI